MRLIDADAVKDIINHIQWDKYEGKPRIVFWADLHEQIDILPTIDPVKHGRWLIEPYVGKHATLKILRCSECDNPMTELLDGKNYNYCPNCGARMDGDDNETD